VVANDDVRRIAKQFEIVRRLRNGVGAVSGRIKIACDRVGLHGCGGGPSIGDLTDAGDVVAIGLGYKDQIVFLLARQVTDDMQELTGKVLVNKQVFHALILDPDACHEDRVRRTDTTPRRALPHGCCRKIGGLSSVDRSSLCRR
jgi:hypothetical protein